MASEETLRRDLQRALAETEPRWLGLSRRMRFRLWRVRQVNAVGIWLCDHGRYRAAAAWWGIGL